MRIAVAGGTGVVGSQVVARLSGADTPVVLARSVGVDLTTRAGLDAALDGVDAVIDVSNIVTTSRRRAVAFFEAVTTNLLAAARRAGVGHVVVLSIVGADRVDLGYYLGKRHQEQLLAAGDVPWTLLRATQFHEFPGQLLQRMRGPLVPVPAMLSQPVAAGEVAAHLLELARGGPAGVALPMAGPQQLQMIDMVRQLVAARRLRRLPVPVRLPGSVFRAMAGGELVPHGPHTQGRITFADHLRAESAEPA